MNTCNLLSNCFKCNGGCNSCNKCTEAAYDCNFSISAVPFDPTTWNVTWCGKLHKVKIPPFPETDTFLSLNYSNATLNYQAEKHNDIITGGQLGSLIAVGDLRDTKVNYDTEALCYELIYHKYGECGEGCKAPEDAWSTFSIDNDGALGPQIRYVRGANRYGCPYFLDVPSDTSQFWFQGWRGDTNENGYYQAEVVDQLPKDENGDYWVVSIDPTTKKPILGKLPWHCLVQNMVANYGVEVEGIWTPIQGTGGFGADFNNVSGVFGIKWTDWNDVAETHPAGYGSITGQINWDASFDEQSGAMKYTFNSIHFDHFYWTMDEGVTQPTAPVMHLWGIAMPSGTETEVIPGVTYGKSNVNQPLDITVPCDQTIYVDPGQSVGPFNFAKIWVDWVNDDEGYLSVKFNSTQSGWTPCE